jgi:hypothetical protein
MGLKQYYPCYRDIPKGVEEQERPIMICASVNVRMCFNSITSYV